MLKHLAERQRRRHNLIFKIKSIVHTRATNTDAHTHSSRVIGGPEKISAIVAIFRKRFRKRSMMKSTQQTGIPYRLKANTRWKVSLAHSSSVSRSVFIKYKSKQSKHFAINNAPHFLWDTCIQRRHTKKMNVKPLTKVHFDCMTSIRRIFEWVWCAGDIYFNLQNVGKIAVINFIDNIFAVFCLHYLCAEERKTVIYTSQVSHGLFICFFRCRVPRNSFVFSLRNCKLSKPFPNRKSF